MAPAELEALLLTHPNVEDAAVIGVPDERVGELPKAYVVTNFGPPVSEEEIQDYIAGKKKVNICSFWFISSENPNTLLFYFPLQKKVAVFKQLKGGVQFVDSIPKSPSGKILRGKLKQFTSSYVKSKL